MPTKLILEDWEDYDNKKIRKGNDSKDFACTETWEVDYLIDKIIKSHSYLTKEFIRSAIVSCCVELNAPYPRKEFVECVARKLAITIS